MSLETLKTRIDYMGGNSINRIKKQKLKSFQSALTNDYNSRPILTPLGERFQALINDHNTKADYDKRYVSVVYEAGLQPGDVFECLDDNTHWMVYLQDLVEVAYLKSEIVRCRYQLEINEEKYWIYFQGPTETALRWNFKRDINWNDLNFSGSIYIKKTPTTQDYFNRFTKLKIDGHTWQVKVRDTLTVPGIIELEVQEYYDSISQDVIEVIRTDTEEKIIGRQTVEADSLVGYQIPEMLFDKNDSWFITNNENVLIEELQQNGRICVVKILDNASGNFILHYGDFELNISIEQPTIQTDIIGPIEVYPYDIQKYYIEDTSGIYSINKSCAKILNQANGVCEIEIVSSKKDNFILTYTTEENIYSLPIKILSL